MKALTHLLQALGIQFMDPSILVQDIVFDSRAAKENSLFIALEGLANDGHDFLNQVYSQGCRMAIVQRKTSLPSDFLQIEVPDSRKALSLLACEWYVNPSREITLVGITGTNGKTTCATLLYHLFLRLGYKAGLLSTVVNKIGNETIPSTHTTPNPLALNALLRTMVDEGCSHCFMEVSSHAVHQHRIFGLQFRGAVFTNITHDHLDYHHTFAAYIQAKKAFFDMLAPDAFALTNRDDRNGEIMVQNTRASKCTYALNTMADFKGLILENEIGGLVMKLNDVEVHTQLIGAFNAYNLLAVYGVGRLLGIPSLELITALSALESVEGRFQFFKSTNGVTVVVDYAHTPDALENVLKTISHFIKDHQKVITVVGCGGDRDKAKRPAMAGIAQKISTQVILTSDNPRTENPSQILQDMQAGINPSVAVPVLSIEDRSQAIQTASLLAGMGDVVLIAGKGHEKYQEINGIKHPFDDFQIAQTFFNKNN
ncbi:MAG: UDP-N-acetylmuramoyl-L-alanyl-D-glutamate--2,6-diaminopimelate ligase [Flavobacteriales bacterium]